MKINRFLALALIALLVVGAMGVMTYRVFAHNNPAPAAQGEEPNDDSDTAGEDAAAGEDDASGDDETGQASPPAAGLTADEAKAIAEAAHPGSAAREVEFEREGGQEFWEVELDNGAEVKVDPATGEILGSGSEQ